jgi:cell fate (sporulation/competence/biofilm development) regulator YlbF (YheA/YmcA/DUF963 family)
MTTPLEIAKTLGQAIAGSSEYQGLLTCEKDFSKNTEAIGLLKSFERERQKLQNLETLGVEVPPSAMSELETIQQKIQDNESIKKLMECQKAYEGLLKQVNDEINKQIDEVTRSVLPHPPQEKEEE